jgi:hypothetical protein
LWGEFFFVREAKEAKESKKIKEKIHSKRFLVFLINLNLRLWQNIIHLKKWKFIKKLYNLE